MDGYLLLNIRFTWFEPEGLTQNVSLPWSVKVLQYVTLFVSTVGCLRLVPFDCWPGFVATSPFQSPSFVLLHSVIPLLTLQLFFADKILLVPLLAVLEHLTEDEAPDRVRLLARDVEHGHGEDSAPTRCHRSDGVEGARNNEHDRADTLLFLPSWAVE